MMKPPHRRPVSGFGGVILAMALLPGDGLAQAPGTIIAADKRVQARTYVFQETGESLPYALFVPSNYDASRPWPLIVGLHGWGRPYDWLMGYDGIVDFAERDGFLMVTPLGYRSTGWFGAPPWPPPPATRPPAAGRTVAQEQALTKEVESLPANIRDLSERDVMHVLEIMRKDFNIDPNRIYLWGHSMGGSGTYHLAAKYPDMWTALAVAAPGHVADLDQLRRFKHIPILVLQGDADQTVPPVGTRESVARMKQLGMECVYIEVRGGDHSLFISKNRDMLSRIFSFFNIVRRGERARVF
jgi:predicted peptidase